MAVTPLPAPYARRSTVSADKRDHDPHTLVYFSLFDTCPLLRTQFPFSFAPPTTLPLHVMPRIHPHLPHPCPLILIYDKRLFNFPPPSLPLIPCILTLSLLLHFLLLGAPAPSLPQAWAPTPSHLPARQQSPSPAPPLSRSNLCSLLYSAPSGMAVASGKFTASSRVNPHPHPPFSLLSFSPASLLLTQHTCTLTPGFTRHCKPRSSSPQSSPRPRFFSRVPRRPAAHTVQVEAP